MQTATGVLFEVTAVCLLLYTSYVDRIASIDVRLSWDVEAQSCIAARFCSYLGFRRVQECAESVSTQQ